jgi:hypothetical protein
VAFRVPTFNLTVNLWRRPALVAAAPTLVFSGNLSFGKRVMYQTGVNAFQTILSPPSELLCPKLTDIYAWNAAGQFSDCVEVPAGSGRYYSVNHVEDVAKGFANEYRLAIIMQLNTASALLTTNPWVAGLWPVPTP